jgi:hypothetical protein
MSPTPPILIVPFVPIDFEKKGLEEALKRIAADKIMLHKQVNIGQPKPKSSSKDFEMIPWTTPIWDFGKIAIKAK